MSSAQVDRALKLGPVPKKDTDKGRKPFNPSHKKHKHEDGRHFKFSRKRSQSFTSSGKFFLPHKRRKKDGGIIPPTKFLLGGNICDPLNLNSMQDEEINRAMNAVTPKSSPLPTPKHRKGAIEVIIPPNICDPLNLSNCNDDDEYEKQLISPTKKGSKRRNRKRKRASSGSGKDDAVTEINKEDKTSEEVEPKPDAQTERKEEKIEIELAPAPLNSPPRNIQAEIKTENIITTPAAATTIAISDATTVAVATTETTASAAVATATAATAAAAATITTSTTTATTSSSPMKDKNKLRLKGLEDLKDKRLRKMDVKDKIVSPVIPQPGAWKPRPQHRASQDKKKKAQKLPNFRAKDAQYQYGNYNRYYGYRNSQNEVDVRLNVFARRKELFFGKDVLDIGCNIGHITLSVARDFSARSVTGIDIDRKLINIARKNVKHYVNCVRSPAANEDNAKGKDSDASFYPLSMPISYGLVDIPGFTKNINQKGFPYNVTFVQGNYILEDDALLASEQPQFDAILCLSITKWLHLNFGDLGLKRAFKRMHAQLRPGGVLLLEPQSWGSYGKKKNLTERIYKNYHSIEFFPHKFTQYLLSPEVGFSKCEVVSIPPHPSKGFQRPIQLFTKAGSSLESVGDPTPVSLTQSERRDFERDLFPKESKKKEGNMSEMSQVSTESLSQYEQLENVYAPSATPCYDTPCYNNDNQPIEPKTMCYVDLGIENETQTGEKNDNVTDNNKQQQKRR